MRRYVVPLLALLAACSGDSNLLDPGDIDISGPWLFAETFSDDALGLTCRDSVPIEVEQSGRHFTATGILHAYCTGPGGTDSIDAPVVITDGKIDGTSVQFEVDGCPYEGAIFGEEPDSLKGTMACQFEDGGTEFNLVGEWRFLLEDRVPPTVSGGIYGGGSGASAALETGDDTLYVRIHAEDNRALRTMGYQLEIDRAFTDPRRDSVLISGTVAEDTLIFPLPLRFVYPLDSALLNLTLFARDTSGNNADPVQLPAVWVLPARQPSVAGTIGGATNDTVGALRDTIEITVTASSPRPLTYIGYRTGGSLSDSVATMQKTDSHVFRIAVPLEWKGILVEFEVFARDQFDFLNWTAIGGVRVVVFPSRPTQIFPGRQGISDLVVDPIRNRLYFPSANQSGEPEFTVFDLATPGYLVHIPMPWFANGIDITPGGDSAIVAQVTNSGGQLGIIDLNTFAVSASAPLAFTPANGRYPFRVRAMGNEKAFVSINGNGGAAPHPRGQLVEYDLTTTGQTLRTDVGAGGEVGSPGLLGRSGDGQRLLLYTPDPDIAVVGQVYRVDTDAFDPPVPIMAFGGGVSGDHGGTHWLVGNQVLAGDLSHVRFLGADTAIGAVSVLSDDGGEAFVAVPEGVARFRSSDGVELERILLPDPPIRMILAPDGNTLIAVASPGLLLIDLR